jgi:uncharacterized membrane-anchored protein YhcB (DUF1043 family)
MPPDKKENLMNKTVVWWQVAIFTFLLNIVTGLVILGFTRSANGGDKMKDELRNKAEKTYVDYQNIKLEQKIDTKVDKEAFKLVTDDIKDIKENTRMIINNQMKQK